VLIRVKAPTGQQHRWRQHLGSEPTVNGVHRNRGHARQSSDCQLA